MEIIDRLVNSQHASIAYKARRLLAGEDPTSSGMVALRDRIPSSIDARRLLSHRRSDGTLPTHPYQKWQGPHWTLYSLTLLAYPPGDPTLVAMRDQVYDWLFAPAHLVSPRSLIIPGQENRPRRCASQEGNAILYSMALGLADERTDQLAERLIAFQWPDGGWNCDKRPEARTSSFTETLIPLRALWHYGKAFGSGPALDAARRAASFLLERRLLFRQRDGTLVKIAWGGDVLKIHYPVQFYDLLFVLQVMAEIGQIGDPRCGAAIELLAAKALPDGGFPLEARNARLSQTIATRGTFADWGPAGKRQANPFVTIDSLWVLTLAGRLSEPYSPMIPAKAGILSLRS